MDPEVKEEVAARARAIAERAPLSLPNEFEWSVYASDMKRWRLRVQVARPRIVEGHEHLDIRVTVLDPPHDKTRDSFWIRWKPRRPRSATLQ